MHCKVGAKFDQNKQLLFYKKVCVGSRRKKAYGDFIAIWLYCWHDNDYLYDKYNDLEYHMNI